MRFGRDRGINRFLYVSSKDLCVFDALGLRKATVDVSYVPSPLKFSFNQGHVISLLETTLNSLASTDVRGDQG